MHHSPSSPQASTPRRHLQGQGKRGPSRSATFEPIVPLQRRDDLGVIDCAGPTSAHCPVVRPTRPNKHRRLDRRRNLAPRDYLQHPEQFGHVVRAVFTIPDGGDVQSRELAEVLHHLVIEWRTTSQHAFGAQVAARFGFSKQTWSATTAGRRWPGHTVILALLATLPPRTTTPGAS